MPEPETPPTLTPDALEERVATAFLEHLLGDRLAGTERSLADYLNQFAGFPARIAEEWLALQGRTPAAATTPSATPHADAQERLGPYRLERELGHGAQGTVYLATDTRLGRQVALKVLGRAIASLGSQALLRLRREADALARLDHPGIATVFEADLDGPRPWLAMRYVPGGSLQQALHRRRERGEAPPATAAEIASAVRLAERAARALAAAHGAGILHRDVKPANLLLAAPDAPVLVDFGLAHDDQSQTPTITLPGAVFGTLAYLPPERLQGGEATAQDDVYGLGVVLHELLTLQRPFQGATAAAELHDAAHAPLRHVRQRNKAVGRDLAVVVATALEREPGRRYQTAAAFADDLGRVLRQEPILARPAGPWLRLLRFCQRERALAGSLAAVLLVLLAGIGATGWFALRESRALADVTRLADLKLARELRERAERLWPARPEQSAAMAQWLAEAAQLQARRPEHEALLARLPAQGTDPTADWQRQQLEQLGFELADFDARIAAVVARRQAAETLVARTIDGHAAAWAAAAGRVAADARFHGLRLSPQPGLVPLGPDPQSGLEEFAHQGSGAVPVREPGNGRLPIDEGSGIVLVLVPGGEAVLGADQQAPSDGRPANVDPSVPEEYTPSYTVRLDPFFLGKHEVTQAQWQRHTGGNPATYCPGNTLTPIETTLHPVELVSWERCDRFARELDLQLPTEAQWEWAYRAGSHTRYPFGDDPRGLQGRENLADKTALERGRNRRWRFLEWLDDGWLVHAPVGSFLPNAWGFHDMGGNLKEWCLDSWEDYPDVAPRPGDGYRFGENDIYRIVRGGSFGSGEDDSRCASRGGVQKGSDGAEAGLRVARRIEP